MVNALFSHLMPQWIIFISIFMVSRTTTVTLSNGMNTKKFWSWEWGNDLCSVTHYHTFNYVMWCLYYIWCVYPLWCKSQGIWNVIRTACHSEDYDIILTCNFLHLYCGWFKAKRSLSDMTNVEYFNTCSDCTKNVDAQSLFIGIFC